MFSLNKLKLVELKVSITNITFIVLFSLCVTFSFPSICIFFGNTLV